MNDEFPGGAKAVATYPQGVQSTSWQPLWWLLWKRFMRVILRQGKKIDWREVDQVLGPFPVPFWYTVGVNVAVKMSAVRLEAAKIRKRTL